MEIILFLNLKKNYLKILKKQYCSDDDECSLEYVEYGENSPVFIDHNGKINMIYSVNDDAIFTFE